MIVLGNQCTARIGTQINSTFVDVINSGSRDLLLLSLNRICISFSLAELASDLGLLEILVVNTRAQLALGFVQVFLVSFPYKNVGRFLLDQTWIWLVSSWSGDQLLMSILKITFEPPSHTFALPTFLSKLLEIVGTRTWDILGL
jgi:hypothetical protein